MDFKGAFYQIRSLSLKNTYWCFERILRIERSFGVRSTYFFLNETYPFRCWRPNSWRLALGYYDPKASNVCMIIRALASDGFEIGLHGSYRSFQDPQLLKKEKRDLEQVLGRSVGGIRQHYLNLSDFTWQMQRSQGFTYDASFGFRDRVGFRDDRFHPFPLDDRKDFYIVPLPIMDSCLMRQPDPWLSALALIDRAQARHACLVLNWHQHVFDENEFPGFSTMYQRLISECRLRGAQFSTIGECVAGIMNETR